MIPPFFTERRIEWSNHVIGDFEANWKGRFEAAIGRPVINSTPQGVWQMVLLDARPFEIVGIFVPFAIAEFLH